MMTGFYCPGCGSQRAVHALLHFDFYGILRYNPLFYLGILVIMYSLYIYIWSFLHKQRRVSLLNHPKTPIILFVVIVLYWVARNIPFVPFVYLAPSS
ncbi:MAG: DUF2752 domain-containing protein [Hyphomicrobiales bacterium]